MMTKMKTAGFMALVAIGWTVSFAAGPDPVANNSDRGPCPVTHRFLKGGWESKGVAIIDQNLTTEWSVPCGDEISDAWQLKDGSVVHSFSIRRKSAGIKLYEDQKLKWTYLSEPGRDNHSCQPLPGGGFLAAESADGAAFMVEIDSCGKKVSELPLELPPQLKEKALKEIFHLIRNARKTSEGTYLAACMSYGKAVEWDAQGHFLREFPSCHYTALRLPNGHTLVSGKKGVLEYDNQAQVVWSMERADFEKLNLRMFMICGLQRLPNGNTIISNVIHGSLTRTGDFYKLIEVTRAKELVWWVDPQPFAGMNMGSFQALDVPGDPAALTVWK